MKNPLDILSEARSNVVADTAPETAAVSRTQAPLRLALAGVLGTALTVGCLGDDKTLFGTGGQGGMETSSVGGQGGAETGGGGAGAECLDEGEACSVGIGDCKVDGFKVCAEGETQAQCDVIAGSPTNETCDNRDNDCNGVVDDPGTCTPLVTFNETGTPCYNIGTVGAGLTASDFVNAESTPSGMCQIGELVTTPDGEADEHTWIWGSSNDEITFECVDAFPQAQAKCSEQTTVPTRQKMVDDFNAGSLETIPVYRLDAMCTIDPTSLNECANDTVFIDVTY